MKTPNVIPVRAKTVLSLAADTEKLLYELYSQSWIDDSVRQQLRTDCAQANHSIQLLRAEVERGRAEMRGAWLKDSHARIP
jgi:hypothetical protein